jgi:hypothetical protein
MQKKKIVTQLGVIARNDIDVVEEVVVALADRVVQDGRVGLNGTRLAEEARRR